MSGLGCFASTKAHRRTRACVWAAAFLTFLERERGMVWARGVSSHVCSEGEERGQRRYTIIFLKAVLLELYRNSWCVTMTKSAPIASSCCSHGAARNATV